MNDLLVRKAELITERALGWDAEQAGDRLAGARTAEAGR
jgi:hypothetical protein